MKIKVLLFFTNRQASPAEMFNFDVIIAFTDLPLFTLKDWKRIKPLVARVSST